MGGVCGTYGGETTWKIQAEMERIYKNGFSRSGWVRTWTGLLWLTKGAGGGLAVVNAVMNLGVSSNEGNNLTEKLLASLKKQSAPCN